MVGELKAGTRVRVTVGLYAGRVGTVRGQTVSSKRWKITLDGVDSFGRQMLAVCTDDELTVVEDEMETTI